MSDDADLSLVSTEALVKELSCRYDGLLIVREKFRTDESCDTLYDFSGGVSRCIGLAERAKAKLLKVADADPHEMDAEDV